MYMRYSTMLMFVCMCVCMYEQSVSVDTYLQTIERQYLGDGFLRKLLLFFCFAYVCMVDVGLKMSEAAWFFCDICLRVFFYEGNQLVYKQGKNFGNQLGDFDN
eukprot:TRINITY_DN50886_c0_g1_i1.p4 TRINITY_DN50886_c0_g1~~TRINITY_DN50886_c0_g1_i1.p4  ORF type:complete len:103 (-),score=10.15 TRINITY_DN50886_c0_g1_i1:203-511(-)